MMNLTVKHPRNTSATTYVKGPLDGTLLLVYFSLDMGKTSCLTTRARESSQDHTASSNKAPTLFDSLKSRDVYIDRS